jgi:hypothetical protein
VGGVAEAEQHERVVAEVVLPDGQRRDPHPAPGEHGPPPRLRRAEADAQRPEDPQPVARAQLAEAPRAGTDVLEHEVEPAVGVASQHREGAREERPLVEPAAPALGGGQHVELPGVRRRAAGVVAGEHLVGADPPAGGHLGQAAPERGERAIRDGGDGARAHRATSRPAGAVRGLASVSFP